jgi:SET domain-containing protein
VKPSPIHGTGTFTTSNISAGEVVWIFGGTLFAREDIDVGRSNKQTLMQIDDGLWLGNWVDEPLSDDYFINHSCDSNLWMKDEVTLVARRDISAGEEATMDYSMHFADPGWTMRNVCSCGSPLCRGTITGRDWMLKDLQERYRDHFSPLINGRIAKLAPD